MAPRKHICFTFAGDISRDSRLRRFSETLSRLYRVSVVTLGDAAYPAPAGVEVHSLPRSHRSLRRSLPSFWKSGTQLAAGLRADLYIASDLYTLPAAARAARKTGGALAYDSRELYSSIAALQGRALTQRFWTLLERAYARRASLLFTVNASIAAILRSRGYAHVSVIRNLPDWKAAERTTLLRDALGISADTCILLSQGGLQRGRGAFIALHALVKVDGCALVFLGDGPLGGELLGAAAALGVAQRVHVLPAVPSRELAAWTASADVGLCLIEALGESYTLSLPNKLFEYLAAGLPVLGSDFPEIGKVLRETGAGIAVHPSDSASIIDALHKLASDPVLRARYREQALTAAVDLVWEKEQHLLVSAVERVLNP